MTAAPRRFGAYEVTLLRDGALQVSTDTLIHGSNETALATARQAIDGDIHMVVNCFLLEGPEGAMLVDAGCGSAWGANFGKARTALATIGIKPEDIGRVLVTHLHGDHVPGLWEGQAPYFPSADILVPESELAFFTDLAARDRLPEARRSGFGLAAHLRQAYGDRVRAVPDGNVATGITTVALPGHTPGHTGYKIGNGENGLLIFADALHLGDLQPQDPDLGLVYDLDPQQAAVTRRRMLAQAAGEGITVTGCHLDGFFKVEADGDAFKLRSV